MTPEPGDSGAPDPAALLTVRVWWQSGDLVARVTSVPDLAAPEEQREVLRGTDAVRAYVDRWLADMHRQLSNRRR